MCFSRVILVTRNVDGKKDVSTPLNVHLDIICCARDKFNVDAIGFRGLGQYAIATATTIKTICSNASNFLWCGPKSHSFLQIVHGYCSNRPTSTFFGAVEGWPAPTNGIFKGGSSPHPALKIIFKFIQKICRGGLAEYSGESGHIRRVSGYRFGRLNMSPEYPD